MENIRRKLKDSNDPLLDEERAEIHRNLRQYSGELENLLKDTKDLEPELARRRQEDIQLKLQSWNSLLAPIRDLPNDILYEIFLQCNTNVHFLDPLRAPLLLCRICTRWRKIAMNSARLWKSLELSLIHKDRDIIPLATDWLMRAKMIPTEFELLVFNFVGEGSHKSDYLLRLFPPPISSNLQSLYLHGISVESLRCLPSNISFPLLYSLDLDQEFEDGQVDDKDGDIKVFEHAPRLCRLTLGHTLDKIIFPWSQLTYLSIPRKIGIIWEAVLPQCTALQSLNIAVDDKVQDNNRHLLSITLPTLSHLKSVAIKFWNASGVSYPPFFDAIEFPCLTYLRLAAQKYSIADGFTDISLSRFLEKIKTIRYLSLCIRSLPITVNDLRRLLKGTPSVSVLELECAVTPFEALGFTPESDPILPSLKTLIVGLAGIPATVLPESLVSLLESRSSSSVKIANRLQRFVFRVRSTLSSRIYEDLKGCLQPYVERGLEVSVLKVVPWGADCSNFDYWGHCLEFQEQPLILIPYS